AAQRPARVLLETRALALPRPRRARPRRTARRPRAPFLSTRPRVGPRRPGRRGAAARLPGDRRDGVPSRLRPRPAPPRARRRAPTTDAGALDRARERFDGAGAGRRAPHARDRGRRWPVGVSRRRHDRRCKVRSTRFRPPHMSYTLTGRIESRLVATLPPLVVALAIHRWWAIELVVLMLVFGLALDVCVYDKLFDYQPAWLALPLGALELGLIVAAVRMPLTLAALGLFALGWVTAQLCSHALFPLLRLEYVEDGGELGRTGATLAASVGAVVLAGAAGALAVIPPTVHLHGVVQGPLVIRHAQTVVGGTVRGGVVILASHVVLVHVDVVGGQNGIDVEGADHVVLDHVHVSGVTLDGIHVRRG